MFLRLYYNLHDRCMTEVMGMEKESFPKYYTILFNGVTDAIAALDQQNFGQAKEILIRSQQAAEDACIEAPSPDNA